MRAIAIVQFLVFVLKLVEAEVNAAEREQYLVSTLFAQTALVEDENAVGVLNGAEAVRDDESGAPGK